MNFKEMTQKSGIPNEISEKIKIPIAIAFGGLVLIFIFAILQDYAVGKSSLLYALCVSVLSIGGSLVASAIVFISYEVFRYMGKAKKRKLLREVLGLGNHPWESVAIVLPHFAIDPGSWDLVVSDNSGSVEFGNTIKAPRMANSRLLAFDDIAAARHISTIFSKLDISNPRIEFDDDVRPVVFGGASEVKNSELENYKVFICIGLYTNFITMQAHDSTSIFRLSLNGLREFGDSEKFKRKVAMVPAGNGDPNTWKAMKEEYVDWLYEESKDKGDFMVLHKYVSPNGYSCVCVGGGNSRGTRKGASFFKKNWHRLTNGGLTTEEEPFGEKQFLFLGNLASTEGSEIDHVVSKSEEVVLTTLEKKV